ncbi:hypothetical protein FRX31_032447 [Thalictrum thalictroides]|uniref:Uncharacterized protein n=1 Tax=Thalictrum thalictroides TaxID=46969 RepID=A0A7J6UZ62_THATH|nr:hypothetical protein FRX31_032447 [Thalictrum thalictroides]
MVVSECEDEHVNVLNVSAPRLDLDWPSTVEHSYSTFTKNKKCTPIITSLDIPSLDYFLDENLPSLDR